MNLRGICCLKTHVSVLSKIAGMTGYSVHRMLPAACVKFRLLHTTNDVVHNDDDGDSDRTNNNNKINKKLNL